jgi:DnaJ family protein C protein 22
MGASLFVAYFLWFFFGWTGLHLFYVGRDEQMFVYLTSCGGFGFGWLRDFWRLPTYCGQADDTMKPLNAELTIHRIRTQSTPGGPHWFQLTRFLSSALVASIYGYITSSVFDLSFLGVTSSLVCYKILLCFGVAIAIWLVGNVGMHTGPFHQALFGAFAGVIVEQGMSSDLESSSVFWCILLSFLRFGQHRTWTSIEAHMSRRGNGGYGGDVGDGGDRTDNRVVPPTKRVGVCGRLVRLGLAGLLFTSMCCSGMYFHGKTTDKETGETTRLRDSFDNLLRSPVWGELYGTLRDSYNKHPTWESFFSAL